MRAYPTVAAVLLVGNILWCVGCGQVSVVGADEVSKIRSSEEASDAPGDRSGSDNCLGSCNRERDGEPDPLRRGAQVGVLICHIPPGNPDNAHTIGVSPEAVDRHLAQGDYLGPCVEDQGGSEDPDADGDGVSDEFDECPDTPDGAEVYDNGCTVIVLSADAGLDVTVTEGDAVSVTGSAEVVQGDYDPANVLFSWEQVSGNPADYEATGPVLAVQTVGHEGGLVFRLTVATQDNVAEATDELTVTVVPPEIVGVVAGKWHNVLLMNNQTIRPWGRDRYGSLGNGSVEDGVADVDAGGDATLLAMTDGTVWTFGDNLLAGSSVPVQIVDVPEVVQVGALSDGGMLLADGGVLWGFGDAENASCQLAGEPYPGEEGVLGPAPIPDLPENIVAVSAGNAHAVALDADGTAWVWGSRFGCTPWAVLDGVVDVAAGQSAYALLLRDDGTVWGIGYNTFGQLGDGTTVSRFTAPTQAVGLTDVVDIAAGDRHSLFVKSDGTLWVSGWNRYCQLGLEEEISPEEPAFGTFVMEATQVGLTDVVAVAGGYLHSVAVRADNTVWVWGSNSIGQLTTGTLTTLPGTVCTPVQIEFAEGE